MIGYYSLLCSFRDVARIWGIILGLLLTLRHINGFCGTPEILGLLLCSVVAIVGISFWKKEKITLSIWLCLFLAACALSLVVGKPDPLKFNWLRFAGFAVAVLALAPLLRSALFREFRIGIWRGWWTGCVVLTAASFVVLAFAMVTGRVAEFQNFGFRGVIPMGMTLSPLAALTTTFSCYKFLFRKGLRTFDWRGAAWLVLFVASLVTAVAAGSRIAVAGMAGCVVVLLAFAWRRGAKKRAWGVSAVVLVAVAVTFCSPEINGSIRAKTALAAEADSMLSSRLDKWEGRLTEFSGSPLTGIGFGAQTVFNSRFDNRAAILGGASPEPGSSWLSLLSQTGLLGTALFLAFLISAVGKSLRRLDPLQVVVFLFLLLNGFSEGWLLYSGSIIFPLFWVLTSMFNDR